MIRTIKWVLFFFFSFAVSWILIITFSQDAFKMTAPVKLFIHTTRAMPIYYYIIGAFIGGLVIGLGVATYYYISLNSKLFKRSREINALEEEIAGLKHADTYSQPGDGAQPAPFPESGSRTLTDGGIPESYPENN
jgi:hypothetical protein